MNKQADIFTIEIIKNALVAIGEEMFLALKRSSKSPIIYESLDYGIGVTDAQGRLISQGNGIPGFIGTLDAGVQNIIEKFDHDNIYPDDVFILNDPYAGGGTHLSDVCMIRPVFLTMNLLLGPQIKRIGLKLVVKIPVVIVQMQLKYTKKGCSFQV